MIFLALALGTLLVTVGALLHFAALRECARRISPELHPVRCFLFSVQIIVVSHLFVAAMFAVSFQLGEAISVLGISNRQAILVYRSLSWTGSISLL
ncbi:hypothetical protein PARPLA_01275 [Rhodobacteraceae bacterium THAF1]|uniref:hypothetical protein n=1 Tax=Palleronia sp. THAF1 TaxID=2587842 RepID=UPI000F40A6DC|nr:hypothetical protein [Palleronia sp. THAF1]QFU07206.1 hypothetical protein FIU81_00805 [Palleronia sp. THAF1]VDC20932.1 hypothetical protein PARPLA_01275 [Rhodobacteraceae bacterium THAF1]